eukprot:scaffold746_cov96-Skeletonema_dohrnii-CCMP3373.AAC.4
MSESDNIISRQAAELLLSKELLELCKSDSISEEGLREIIERHQFLTPPDYEFFFEACRNEDVNEGIIRCLLEHFPAAASANIHGGPSLRFALSNKNMTRNIIQLLIEAAPNTVRSADIDGRLPLHCLCGGKNGNEIAAIEILKLLIGMCPEAAQRADSFGYLPIHIAVITSNSTKFCRMLIEAYPGSERIIDDIGMLPFHCACLKNNYATVEYLYELYPDSINHATPATGYYPIHIAIQSMIRRSSTIEIVEFLLNCDPNVKLQKFRGIVSLLLWAYHLYFEQDGSSIEAAVKVIKVIFDAYPEAIEDDKIASNIQSCHEQVQAFLNGELVYARLARDHRLMTTPDGNGQLPLHRALRNNVRLGSIKLLVKGNALAVQSPDNSGAIPLHVACQHHESANVVQYLIALDTASLDAVDRDGNTALHLVCRGARHEIIALLLDKYGAVSVSKRNACDKLPIDLLWESNEVLDRDSIEYTESVFRLIKAYPETLLM